MIKTVEDLDTKIDVELHYVDEFSLAQVETAIKALPQSTPFDTDDVKLSVMKRLDYNRKLCLLIS